MDKEILCFDIDNTLSPFVEPLIKLYNHKYNDNIKFEDIVTYDFQYMLNPKCSDIFEEFVNESFFKTLIPYPNVFNSIEKLEQKYYIIFATKAYPYSLGWREDWLKKWYKNYSHDKLYRMPCKQLLNGNIFGLVDDALEENFLGGNYQSFCVSQPWNLQYGDRYLRRHNNIVRIDSVNDLVEILL